MNRWVPAAIAVVLVVGAYLLWAAASNRRAGVRGLVRRVRLTT